MNIGKYRENLAGFPELATLTEAAKFTGMDAKTVRKRIEGLPVVKEVGRCKYYNAKKLIQCSFIDPNNSEEAKIDLATERAKYFKSLRNKVDLEAKRLSGELVNMDEYDNEQEKYLVVMRDRLLQMGKKMALRLGKISDSATITRILTDEIRVIMEDIAQRADDEAEETELTAQ